MTTFPRRRFLALTAALVWTGCSGTPSPTEPDANTPSSPTFNFSNGPGISGRVLRFSIEEGFFFTGVDENFTTGVFFSPENGLLSNLLERCTPTTATSPLDFHWVETPDAVRLLVQNKEAFTYVFDIQPSWFNPDAPTCQDLLDNMIATGQSRFQFNDNDWLGTGHATNAVSMKANGRLEDLLNGGEIRLHMFLHWQFLKNVIFRELKFELRLSPDPRSL